MPNLTVTSASSQLAGKISELSMSSFSQGPIITTVVNSGGNLELIAWDLAPSGVLTRLGSIHAGTADHVDCVCMTETLVIAAVRESSGKLKLIAYSVDPAASPVFTRLCDALGPAASLVKIARISSDGFATFISTPTHHVHLTIWKYHAHTKTLTSVGRHDWAPTGSTLSVRDVAVCCTDIDHVITVTDQDGSLEFRYWTISNPSALTSWVWTSPTPMKTRLLSLLPLNFEQVVMSYQGGPMKIVLWTLDTYAHWSPGSTATGAETSDTPALTLLDSNPGGPWFATVTYDSQQAVWIQIWQLDGNNQLQLQATQMDSDTAEMARATNGLAGLVTGTMLYSQVPDPEEPVQQLRVKSWQIGGSSEV